MRINNLHGIWMPSKDEIYAEFVAMGYDYVRAAHLERRLGARRSPYAQSWLASQDASRAKAKEEARAVADASHLEAAISAASAARDQADAAFSQARAAREANQIARAAIAIAIVAAIISLVALFRHP